MRCDSGYTLRGARRVTCENGRFSPPIENHQCEKRKCFRNPKDALCVIIFFVFHYVLVIVATLN